MHRWLFGLAGAFTALAVLVLGTGSATADQTIRVEMGTGNAFVFRPNAFNVGVGEKITFNAVNTPDSGRPHDIHIEGPGGFVWELVEGNGNVPAGQTMTGTTPAFATAGTYQMWCPVGQHRAQGMVATIQVGAVSGGALPRTGEPMTLIGGALGAMGALSLAGGLFLRRRSG